MKYAQLATCMESTPVLSFVSKKEEMAEGKLILKKIVKFGNHFVEKIFFYISGF